MGGAEPLQPVPGSVSCVGTADAPEGKASLVIGLRLLPCQVVLGQLVSHSEAPGTERSGKQGAV